MVRPDCGLHNYQQPCVLGKVGNQKVTILQREQRGVHQLLVNLPSITSALALNKPTRILFQAAYTSPYIHTTFTLCISTIVICLTSTTIYSKPRSQCCKSCIACHCWVCCCHGSFSNPVGKCYYHLATRHLILNLNLLFKKNCSVSSIYSPILFICLRYVKELIRLRSFHQCYRLHKFV